MYRSEGDQTRPEQGNGGNRGDKSRAIGDFPLHPGSQGQMGGVRVLHWLPIRSLALVLPRLCGLDGSSIVAWELVTAIGRVPIVKQGAGTILNSRRLSS